MYGKENGRGRSMGKPREEEINIEEKLGIEDENFSDEIFDVGAKVIDFFDMVASKAKQLLKKFGKVLMGLGALIITGIDNLGILLERLFINIKYQFFKAKHSVALFLRDNTKSIVVTFTGLIVVSILLLSVLNMFTGYEYSYKGRSLGIVKSEDDVDHVVGLVNKGLSRKYNMNIEIDTESDIKFEKTYSFGKDVDNSDMVLKRLSSMSDARSEAYAIKVNGKAVCHTETEKGAQDVLNGVVAKYIKPADQKKYESIGFVEDVQVQRDDTIIADIKSEQAALQTILQGNKNESKYTMKEDDSIIDVAERAKTSVEKLQELNPSVDIEDLEKGDQIVIAEAMPSITVKAVSVITYSQSIAYTTTYEKDSSMYEGDSKTYRNGENGIKSITSRVTYYNGHQVAEDVLTSKVTKNPVAQIVLQGSAERPATVGSGSFAWPSSSHMVTGYYGYEPGHYSGFHSGIDISGMGYGAPITASDGGTVTTAGVYGGYGNCVIIDHQNGYETLYGHNSSLNVAVGDKVYKGQQIAEAGSTGFSFAVHCHFEIHKNGSTVNPLDYLP